MARVIDFYFDYTCPFAYLASTQVQRISGASGVEFVFRPVLLGGVFRALGTEQNLFESLAPAKRAHNLADMQRWARRYGVPLNMPAAHPMRSVEALRATLATGLDPDVISGFFRAYWVEGLQISSRDVVARIVQRAGHDPASVLEAIETPAFKDELARRTDEAVARGVFGVPTFVDGDELWWGQDRMSFAFGLRETPTVSDVAHGRMLDFYWDFSSPFAYLAASQVETLAVRTRATLRSHPVLLGGLFRIIGQEDVPLATFSEPKRRHVLADLQRWAGRWQIPFRFPSRFPTRSLDALRLYLALPEARRAAFRSAVFQAYWAEDRDITSREVLASCGADAEAFAMMESESVKRALRTSTEAAAKAGIFGVPTFVIDGTDLYWGQDRLDLVEEQLGRASPIGTTAAT